MKIIALSGPQENCKTVTLHTLAFLLDKMDSVGHTGTPNWGDLTKDISVLHTIKGKRVYVNTPGDYVIDHIRDSWNNAVNNNVDVFVTATREEGSGTYRKLVKLAESVGQDVVLKTKVPPEKMIVEFGDSNPPNNNVIVKDYIFTCNTVNKEQTTVVDDGRGTFASVWDENLYVAKMLFRKIDTYL